MSELKPCPFCSSSHIKIERQGCGYDGCGNEWGKGKPTCQNCGASAEDVYNWNKRDSGWISVEDRLPEHFDPVIICYDGIVMHKTHFYDISDGSFKDCSGNYTPTDKKTHWRNLPQPPKEG